MAKGTKKSDELTFGDFIRGKNPAESDPATRAREQREKLAKDAADKREKAKKTNRTQ